MQPEQLSQVDTEGCTTMDIMLSRAFAAGVHDVRHGLPPRFDVFACADDRLWAYERGRLWACIAPVTMKITVKREQLNYRAVALFDAAWERRLIT